MLLLLYREINQKRKTNTSSEVAGKDKAKRVSFGAVAGGSSSSQGGSSTHCVNHFAKELGVSKKGCVMRKGKVCSRIHLSKPLGSARLSEDIKNDLKCGIANFAESVFKINFLRSLDDV
jgi:hypothetical protein